MGEVPNRNPIDSATFMNERNFKATQRERSARKSGAVPLRLDPLDSRRANQNNKKSGGAVVENSSSKSPTVHKDGANDIVAPRQHYSCMEIASNMQALCEKAKQCFEPSEIRRLLDLNDSSMLPICLTMVVAVVPFVLGVYVTKKGMILTSTTC